MRTIQKVSRRLLAYFTALVLAAGYPLAAMADTQEPMTSPVEVVQQAPDPIPEPEQPKLTYTYNSSTGRWDSQKWQYNPETGKYETPAAPVIIEPVQDDTSNEETKNVDTTVKLDNDISADSTSGDAAVADNTAAGGATSGDTEAMATLLNIVNSSVETGNNQKVASFTQDILGDVKGDIVLYPMLLKAMLEAQAGGDTSSTIDVKNNFEIDNKVDLAAKSGNAAVTGNTSAGDATTGSAKAVANVVNILNSMIATQQSFIGTINIYGNLEGDILIAPDFIPQMLANNKNDGSGDMQLSTKDSTTIVNNISTVAESGAAAVFGNTSAGNATSGKADTGVVIFNLTGHEIIAKNSLLVFVNVLGKWVGVIVDAPVGATAALVGNGVTSNNTYSPDLKVNSESSHGITNSISLVAESGDAVVSGNTMAGGATTGSAMALANVANISGSQFGVTDWFGVLFINVFQNWYGSFGIDTFYGNTEEPPVEVPSGPIQFIPKEETSVKPSTVHISSSAFIAVNTQTSQVNSATTTLASSTSDIMTTLGKSTTNNSFDTGFDFRLFIVAGSLLAVGLSLLGLKKLFS
ncbi:MAG: hypothetical protein WAQ27_01450 [Candidatus Microsaccharimonas sp.]